MIKQRKVLKIMEMESKFAIAEPATIAIKVMVFKKSKYWLIGIVSILFFFIYRNSYTEFSPMLFDGDYYKKIVVNNEFYNNLTIVLDYHNATYKIDDNGKVLIKRSLASDEELIHNYTKKALDTAWLNSHHSKK